VNNKTILPVAASKELKNKKPLKTKFQEQDIVLFRHGMGISAFLDVCPHRGIPLSSGCLENGNIICPYHNWKFNSEGILIDVPGDPNFKSPSSPLVEIFFAKEFKGIIWLGRYDFDTNKLFSPSVNSTHEQATIIRKIKANKIDIAENFLDALHTHSIHTGIIRTSKAMNNCSVTIRNVEDGYEAEYVEDKKQTGVLSQLFGNKIKKSIGRIRYPGVIEIEYISDSEIEMSVVIYVVEECNNSCKLILKTYLKRSKIPFIFKALLLAPFQLLVLWQDKKILEKQSRSLELNPKFKPITRKTDIMRKYIEKVYKKNFEECLITRNIKL